MSPRWTVTPRSEGDREAPATLRLIGQSAAGASFSGVSGLAKRSASLPEQRCRRSGRNRHPGECRTATRRSADKRGCVQRNFYTAKGSGLQRRRCSAARRPRPSPRDIGLVASMNLAWLPVRRKPRVALLATGDELVMPGEAIDMTGSSAPRNSPSPHLSGASAPSRLRSVLPGTTRTRSGRCCNGRAAPTC